MNDWDAMKTLDRYVLDYMIKKKMHKAAETFVKEANIAPEEVAINSPDGFLSEWWSVFWDFYTAANQPPNAEEAANETENAGQSSKATPSVPELTPQAFSTMLPSLLSSMPMPEMMNQQTLTPIPNPATNQEAVTVLPSPIPMNQPAVVLMQPGSSIIPNPPINPQAAMGLGLMKLSNPNPGPSMMDQRAIGLMQPPGSIAMNQQRAMGLMLPPRSPVPIPMNQMAPMAMMHAPNSSIPMSTGTGTGTGMVTPGSISPELYQQMVAQLPESLREEPISILLAKMYEHECLRRSARDLAAAKGQHVDPLTLNINPLLAFSSPPSYATQQNAENLQQWFGREDKRPISFERSNVVVPASLVASMAMEVPDTGSSTNSLSSSSSSN